MGDLRLYNDPTSGSTLATESGKMSEQAVRDELAQSRSTFAPYNAVEEAKKSGGFSFNPKDGSVPKDGYMVETHLDRGKDLGHPATAEDIKKFTADNKDVLDKNPNLHVGGWGNTLGISERIADQDAAIKAGTDRNQKAIFDVKNGKDIPTGGTGEVKPTVPAHEDFAKLSPTEQFQKGIANDQAPAAAPKKPMISETGKSFDEQKFPKSYAVEVKFPDGTVHTDEVKGLNQGHALARAKENWPGSDVKITKDTTPIKPANPALSEDRVSTRVPTAKPKKGYTPEEHMGEEPLTVGRDAVNKDPRLAQKLADVVSKYPDFKMPKGIKDPAKILDRFTSQMKDNLLHVYDSVEPAKQAANAKWYESVNKKATNDAQTHGIEPRQAAGVYASLSPQKDWDMNASLAQRVMDTHFNHADDVGSPKMREQGMKLANQAKAGAEAARAEFEATGETDPKIVKTKQRVYAQKMKNATDLEGVVDKVAGQKYSDLTNPYEKGVWVRLHDEVNNSRNYPKIDPGTGNALEDVTKGNGEPAKVAWGSMEPIARAVSILQDGSRANISEQLGGEHKVRNFYNNIIDPTNNKDVTIDTHAVAAAHLQPFSGQSKEVGNNFGGAGKSAPTGVHGAYPLYAEAYRQAAAERGVLPREMQSVTWEKIREMFPKSIKTAEFQQQAKDIWKKYSSGKASIEDTRAAIGKAADDARAALPVKKPKPAGRPGTIKALDFLKILKDNKNAPGLAALGEQK
jgi:hypothetical protein